MIGEDREGSWQFTTFSLEDSRGYTHRDILYICDITWEHHHRLGWDDGRCFLMNTEFPFTQDGEIKFIHLEKRRKKREREGLAYVHSTVQLKFKNEFYTTLAISCFLHASLFLLYKKSRRYMTYFPCWVLLNNFAYFPNYWRR